MSTTTYSPRQFLDMMYTEWNLPQDLIDECKSYFLERLTAAEITEIIHNQFIKKGGSVYGVRWSKKGKAAFLEEQLKTEGDPKYFWLSYRTAKFPGKDGGVLLSVVIIQLDIKS